jgi:Cu2+-exporting ATPase
VAGVGMMQAMMYGVALYAGAFEGMEPTVRDFFRWVSMAVAPVVFYAGQPFFSGASRELKARRLGMDTPVALALALAFAASIFESWRGGAEVYFDSLTMFVFFLLRVVLPSGRAPSCAGESGRAVSVCCRWRRVEGDFTVEVATLELEPGDRSGRRLPIRSTASCWMPSAKWTGLADRRIASIDKRAGDLLLAGSVAVSRPLRLCVRRTVPQPCCHRWRAWPTMRNRKSLPVWSWPSASRLFHRPRADLHRAGRPVWLWLVPERALPSPCRLVVSCPCALSWHTYRWPPPVRARAGLACWWSVGGAGNAGADPPVVFDKTEP